MKSRMFACWMLAAFASVLSFSQTPAGYYCAPCNCPNDAKVLETGGQCPLCGMQLLRVGTYNYSMPFVSASGSFAYESNRSEGKIKIFFRRSVADTSDRLLCEGSMPLISADGASVLYTPKEGVVCIYDLKRDTAEDVSTRFHLVLPQTPSWTPDGKGFICAAGTFPRLGIYRVDLVNGTVDTLIAPGGIRYGAVYSPGGDRIAYRCIRQKTETERERGLAVFDLATGTERYITSIGEYCSWSPDGQQLLFQWANEGKRFCIYAVKADGTELTKIVETKDGDNEMPRWSPEGTTVYFQTNRRHGNWEIWTMHADGSNQQPYIWK